MRSLRKSTTISLCTKAGKRLWNTLVDIVFLPIQLLLAIIYDIFQDDNDPDPFENKW